MVIKWMHFPWLTARTDFFDASEPYAEGDLPVSPVHTIHFKEYGNRNGIPIVHLHGGPGLGASTRAHQFYNPKKFRIIIPDQRGCGNSTPEYELADNTPDAIADDHEKLRQHLGIQKWHLVGGSWGATVAIMISQKYPDTVLSRTLHAPWLMRPSDCDYLYQTGSTRYPEAFARFRDHLTPEEQTDIVASYLTRLQSSIPSVRMQASFRWNRYEREADGQDPSVFANLSERQVIYFAKRDFGAPLITAHFLKNEPFTPEDRLLRNETAESRSIPSLIIQGQYDQICPPSASQEFQAASQAHLIMIPSSHSSGHPDIRAEIIKAVERIRKTGSPVPCP